MAAIATNGEIKGGELRSSFYSSSNMAGSDFANFIRTESLKDSVLFHFIFPKVKIQN